MVTVCGTRGGKGSGLLPADGLESGVACGQVSREDRLRNTARSRCFRCSARPARMEEANGLGQSFLGSSEEKGERMFRGPLGVTHLGGVWKGRNCVAEALLGRRWALLFAFETLICGGRTRFRTFSFLRVTVRRLSEGHAPLAGRL